MTKIIADEKILELAEQYMDVFPDDYTATKEQLIHFAHRVAEIAHSAGWCEGHKSGSTGVFGEPLG